MLASLSFYIQILNHILSSKLIIAYHYEFCSNDQLSIVSTLFGESLLCYLFI